MEELLQQILQECRPYTGQGALASYIPELARQDPDRLGIAAFDKDGNMNNWWTEEDAAAFKAKTDILVKQFDAIEVLPAKDGQPAIMANGALCLGENIADQGGLRVSHTAFRNSLNGTEPAPIDGFTADQRFYLAYATLWAQNIRDEEIARLTKLDVHSLGKWRVNATLRNLQDFYDAFSMTDGEMFMPEEERVVIW